MSQQVLMVDEILQLFQEQPCPLTFLDATFGQGGHSRAILDHFHESRVIALDRDPKAVAYGQTSFQEYGDRFAILHERFSHIGILFPEPIFSGILFDLGMGGEEGDFSYTGALDMRMEGQGISASDLINDLSEQELADLFSRYGEENSSKRIAHAIAKARAHHPLTQADQLSSLIRKVISGKSSTARVFQALRIAVNNEIEELQEALPAAAEALKPGGCLVVISFHSLEDRLVKSFFNSSDVFQVTSKKLPHKEDIQLNPRALSAHLRFGIRKS